MAQTLAERLAALRRDFEQALAAARRPADLDAVKSRFLGRKAGALPAVTAELSRMPPAERKEAGRLINEAKALVEGRFDEAVRELAARERDRKIAAEGVDVTLPGRLREAGTLHPITQTRLRIEEIFREMGYTIESGPEVETDFHNFAALNMPPDHPARDTQDTFYLEGDLVLRTHTSPVQIRTMLREKPPIKMIAPGPVYRRDYDLTHLPMFHQVEALVVDRGIRFSDLKGTLEQFCRRLFGASVAVRLSPTYFPFVEPGAEVNISCTVCGGSGCRTCRMTGWLEVLGAGMVHPAVFRAVGYDPEVLTGFAFGMGIDRIAMLERGIDDLRLLLENDLRFLRQFPG